MAEVFLSSLRLHGRTQLAPRCMKISSQTLGQLVIKYMVNPLSWKDLEMGFFDCFLLAKPGRRGGGSSCNESLGTIKYCFFIVYSLMGYVAACTIDFRKCVFGECPSEGRFKTWGARCVV